MLKKHLLTFSVIISIFVIDRISKFYAINFLENLSFNLQAVIVELTILKLALAKLIEEGTHLELLSQGGLYAQLADLQERGLSKL